MKLQIFTIAIITFFSITACNEVIDLTLDDPEPVLVVDGYISDIDTIQFLRLSSLENYFSEQTPNYAVFQNSDVYLMENGIVVDTFTYQPVNSRFEVRYQGVEGKEYQVDITLSDGSRYISAAETMTHQVPIDTIWFETNEKPGGPGPRGKDIVIKINTHEPEPVGDNYQWKSYVNDQYQFESSNFFFQDDRLVNGKEVKELEVFGMKKEQYDEFQDESPNGKVFVRIEQATISVRYFEYLKLVFRQVRQVGGPFAAPPAEIRGNVYKQGENEVLALGYFYTAAISSETVEVVK